MIKFRNILLICSLVAVSSLFFACGKKSDNPQPQVTTQNENSETQNNSQPTDNQTQSNNSEADNKSQTDSQNSNAKQAVKPENTMLKSLIDEIQDTDVSSAGSSLKIAQIFADFINQGSLILSNTKESKEYITNVKKTFSSKDDYDFIVDQLTSLSKDFYSGKNNVQDLIDESGMTINKNHVSEKEFNEILKLLK